MKPSLPIDTRDYNCSMSFEKSIFDNNQISSVINENDNDSLQDNSKDWYNRDELEYDDGELIQKCSDKVFCFETDHAALIGNNDYQNLIKTLSILQAQRIKIIEDIDTLEHLRHKVRENPREYLNKMLHGDTSDIPSRIEVEQVPKINWSNYSRKAYGGDIVNTLKEEEHAFQKERESDYKVVEISNTTTVRGRIFDQTKPQTFNQLWTAEEQLRLEELLVDFPPERNENNRWRKIAETLGNRTTKQVCSRVQKYFKKLNKAGLPIPGHQLKTNTMTSLKKKPRKQKKISTRDSTFFPTQHLGAPQHLDGCEEDAGKTKTPTLTTELKADIVKKVIEYKKKDAQLPPFSHPGVSCVVCEESPLRGTCWRCLVCQSVNMCSDCVISQLYTECASHPPCHPLEPLANPTVDHWDPDYMPDSFKSTNYLDPNFVSPNVL